MAIKPSSTDAIKASLASLLAAWIPFAWYASDKALVTQPGMGRNFASRAGISRTEVKTSSRW